MRGANFESGVIFDTSPLVPARFLSRSYLSHTSAAASLAYIRLPEDETDFAAALNALRAFSLLLAAVRNHTM